MAISKWFNTGYDAVQEYSKELEEKQSNSGKQPFVLSLVLKDGESRIVKFITKEPVTFREHYLPNAKGKKFYTCLDGMIDEHGNRMECPFCSAGNKPSFRGAYLVLDRTEDKWESNGEVKKAKNQIKLFKQGIKVLKVLDKMSSKRDITEWDIEITRTGSGTDTQYNFIPDDRTEMTKEEEEKIENFKDGKTLLDRIADEIEPLTEEDATAVLMGKKPSSNSGSSKPSYSDDDTIGF